MTEGMPTIEMSETQEMSAPEMIAENVRTLERILGDNSLDRPSNINMKLYGVADPRTGEVISASLDPEQPVPPDTVKFEIDVNHLVTDTQETLMMGDPSFATGSTGFSSNAYERFTGSLKQFSEQHNRYIAPAK